MTYLLDTNVCIIYLNGKSSELRDRLNSTPIDKIRICSIVKSELFYGSMRSNNPVSKTRRLGELQLTIKVFVQTGYGAEESKMQQDRIKPDRIAPDLCRFDRLDPDTISY